VLARLVLLSVLVGVVLSAIGLDPMNIVHSIEKLIRHVWNMGFDAVRWLWRYFLLGAVLVVPIWLLVRLARGTDHAQTDMIPKGCRRFGQDHAQPDMGASAPLHN
jgi:hypothetical protein